MKDRQTAGLIALFLGGLGIHRFYVGDITLGIIYLLFSWTLVPIFIGVIDALVWAFSSDETFNKQYNKPKPVALTGSKADELQKLHDLKEKGILTQEEFNQQKKKIL